MDYLPPRMSVEVQVGLTSSYWLRYKLQVDDPS